MKSAVPLITKYIWYGSISVAVIILGVLLLLLRTCIIETVVAHELVLGPNSRATQSWITPPTQLYLDMYFFNWTNPEQINDPTSKPNLQEVGPYRFREKKEKVNITWNNNDTVTYMVSNTWYFDEEASTGKLSDKITTVNMILLMAAKELKDCSYWTKKGFSFTLGTVSRQIHITKTAKELLFDGYHDKLLDAAQTLSFLSKKKVPEKAGFMVGRNGSYTHYGVLNMATGAKGNSGEVLNWNYKNNTDFFTGNCNKIHGSSAELFRRKRSRNYVDVFTQEACSTLRLYYEKDDIVKGISGYTYTAGHKMFDNGTSIPENKCYQQGELPSGLLNITKCSGVELFASLPHFYGADPTYLSQIDGLQPNKEKHDSFFTIEPTLGLGLKVAFRLQTSFFLEPVEYLSVFENIPRVFIPTLWFEEVFVVPDNLALGIKLLLNLPLLISIVGGLLVGFGIFTLVYVVMLNLRIKTDNYNVRQINVSKQNQAIVEKKPKQEYVV